MRYLNKHRTRRVAQWVPLPGSTQVPNSAGGFAWAVDDWTRLRRFLVLGAVQQQRREVTFHQRGEPLHEQAAYPRGFIGPAAHAGSDAPEKDAAT